MQDKTKHLEFVQNVITRMNTNSFQLKGWMTTIVAALLALYASGNGHVYCIFAAIVPVIIFWFLDAYYLKQERLFLKLYQDIVNTNNVSCFDMDVSKYKVYYCKVFWSKTIAGLYFTVAILLLFLGLFLCYKDIIVK